MLDLNTLSIAQLVALYNSRADKPVKSFSTKTIALQRVQKLCEERGLCPVLEGDEPALRTEDELLDSVSPGVVSDEEVAARAEPEQSAKAPQPEQPAAPAETVAQQVRRLTAERQSRPKKTAKVASGGKPGPVATYSDDMVITVVTPITAREGTNRARRFAGLRTGATVGQYLDAAHAANDGKRSRGRYLADLIRLAGEGKVSVGPASE